MSDKKKAEFVRKIIEENQMKRILLITIALSVLIWADTARYTRNDAGIVTDHKTRLQWQDDYSNNNIPKAKWIDAIHYCETLSLNDYTDWRLPNFNELYSLDDQNRTLAFDSAFHFQDCSDAISYWSSTSLVGYENHAWVDSFFHLLGGYGSDDKSNSNCVRCVRSGQ